jgi:lactate permease
MLFVVCLLTMMQAYVIPWMIPVYEMIQATALPAASDISKGFIYLLVLALILALIAFTVFVLNRKNAKVAVAATND